MLIESYLQALRTENLHQRVGKISRLIGEVIESNGPDAFVGEICEIYSPRADRSIMAEVIGLNSGKTLLFPYDSLQGISQGCEVFATGKTAHAQVGPELLGRVLDGFGRPLDGGDEIHCQISYPLNPSPINPLHRSAIERPFETQIKAIDSMLTLGVGQKIGLFAGSGVGKTSLLNQLLHGSNSDIRVIALIGERGREVREFVHAISKSPELKKKTIVVAATSDQSPLQRIRAAYLATSIAEYFRDQNQSTLLVMDSVTRFAMAQRELGLSIGEPPTARGYTPSVFNHLTRLVERCGGLKGKGAITGVYTILVEGDDMNEPIADNLRATLDGHIVLSRELANQRHFPSIDVLKSASRLLTSVNNEGHLANTRKISRVLSYYERYREMVNLGVYEKGANTTLDRVIEFMPALNDFLRQTLTEFSSKKDSDTKLATLSSTVVDPE